LRIRWTNQASADLDNIEAYITQDSPRGAVKTVLGIIEAVEQLREFPALGRAGRVVGTRELVLPDQPYIVPYRVKDNIIEIIAVFHTSRRWPEESTES
jgi:toxin ParE1/3/4